MEKVQGNDRFLMVSCSKNIDTMARSTPDSMASASIDEHGDEIESAEFNSEKDEVGRPIRRATGLGIEF